MAPRQTHTVSTHVLDNEHGKPASGVRVTLERLDGDSFVTLTDLVTDADGRIDSLLAPFELEPAIYQVNWDAGGYFRLKGGEQPFVRIFSLAFEVKDTEPALPCPAADDAVRLHDLSRKLMRLRADFDVA